MSVLYYNVTLQLFFLHESFVSSMIEAERFPVLLSEKKKNINAGGYFHICCVNIIL